MKAELRTVAALYVLPDGPYAELDNVDPWPESRDARLYDGPHPVVAHPPCARWGRYWFGGPSAKVRRTLGDDGGCFAAAVASVRRWGGVLEHPEASHAWKAFGIAHPPKAGGWVRAGLFSPGYTCCVEQGHYGHRARKATWLYVVGVPFRELPTLIWGPSEGIRLDDGYHSAAERKAAKAAGTHQVGPRLSDRERRETPVPFRDVLIKIARSVEVQQLVHSEAKR